MRSRKKFNAARGGVGKPFRATGGAATIAAAQGEGKPLATFAGVAYTGAEMRPEGWGGRIICVLAGIRVPSQHRPTLRQHDHEQIVGHTDTVEITAAGVEVAGVFSGEEQHTKKVTGPAKNGFRWQLSIGATPTKTHFVEAGATEEVNGREVTGPITVADETELGEISFVPLGADGDTSATVSASKRKGIAAMSKFHKRLKAYRAKGNSFAAGLSAEDIDKMSDDEAKAALKKCMAADEEDLDAEEDEDLDAEEEDGDDTDLEGEEDEDLDAEEDEPAPAKAKASKRRGGIRASVKKTVRAQRVAAAKELTRQDKIRAALKKHGVTHAEVGGKTVNLEAHAIRCGWTAEKTELHALRAARPGPGVGNGPTVYVTNRPELNEAVLEAAVFHAARHQFKLTDDEFYTQPTPDGTGTMRRMPLYLQREAQGAFNARYTDQVQQAAHTIFRGRVGPQEIVSRCFRANGSSASLDLKSETGIRSMMEEWHHTERAGFRAEGASTLSISNILSNVMNKFALQGYLFTEQAWREVCAIRNVNDFKPTKSINLLGDVMYKQIGSTGELDNASLGDQAFANQAKMFGRIMTMPWMHIANDDLGILTGAPQKIGQGAGLALNDDIWTLWKNMAAGAVNGDDGNPFWRTTSSVTAAAAKNGTAYKPNKISGAGSAMSSDALKSVRAMFDNQIDPNGNPLGFDGLTPILLHGPSNWQPVTALLQSAAIVYGGATAAAAGDKNVWQGQFKPVMSRYVENANYVNSATAWWVLFNPVALAAIEVCFLNGVDTPAVLQAGPDFQFDRLGVSIRGTMPFGSNQQNFRGGVYAVGA